MHATALGRRWRVIRRWSMPKLLRPSRATTPTQLASKTSTSKLNRHIHTYIHTYIHTCIGPTQKTYSCLPFILLSNIHPQCYFRTYYIRISFNTVLNTYLHTYIHTYIHTLSIFISIYISNIIQAHQYL